MHEPAPSPYLARIDKAVAELKALAWDLIEMEFAPDTPDGGVHRERYRTIRKRVNDIADGCYGIGPSGDELPPPVPDYEPAARVIAGYRGPWPPPAACVHCGGSGVKCCEFGADR